jgi:glycosyltransferase involved in cell wall biosynthesis
MRAVFSYRHKIANDADVCVFPQQARLLKFLEATKRIKPVYCVWNCPRVDEVSELTSPQDQGLIVYYHGSITSVRLPRQVIIAASRFRGAVRVRIAGYETPGSIGYVAELTSLAAKNGVAGLIEPLGAIPRHLLLRSASRAHVGLSLMPKRSEDINMQHMVGASNKAFDYMACGLPLLVTDLPEWASTFVEPGFARSCDPDDPDSIEAVLRWYLEHPDERRRMARKCRNKILRAWNYETVFANVEACIERC